MPQFDTIHAQVRKRKGILVRSVFAKDYGGNQNFARGYTNFRNVKNAALGT
jgi:hypothetical protein